MLIVGFYSKINVHVFTIDVIMGLKEINLKEEYRSDRDDIVAEFFFPCLSNCIEYDRCVDFL